MLAPLEVLSLYLPHRVEVEVSTPGAAPYRALLCAIDADTQWVKVRQLRSAAQHAHPDFCKPVLRDFRALCDPLTLPDGRVVVPLIEVAKMMAPGCDNWLPLTTAMLKEDEIAVFNAKGFREFSLYAHQVKRLPAEVADYLRSLYFAVGLDPIQYVTEGQQGE